MACGEQKRSGSGFVCNILCVLLTGCMLLFACEGSAQEFKFKDMQGQEQRLSGYLGKWVLVNFWATWCSPCLSEMPELVALHNAHKDKDLVVIGVALDSTRESVAEFVSRLGVTYPVVFGDYKMAAQVGKVNALPTSYLFDPAGKAVASQEGMLTQSSVEAYMRAKSKRQE